MLNTNAHLNAVQTILSEMVANSQSGMVFDDVYAIAKDAVLVTEELPEHWLPLIVIEFCNQIKDLSTGEEEITVSSRSGKYFISNGLVKVEVSFQDYLNLLSGELEPQKRLPMNHQDAYDLVQMDDKADWQAAIRFGFVNL